MQLSCVHFTKFVCIQEEAIQPILHQLYQSHIFREVQKKCPLLENAPLSAARQSNLPIHSPMS